MSILNKFLPQKENKEYFLTVAVEENRILATVAEIKDREVIILGSGEGEFSQTSEETEAADIAISEAEKKIGADVLVEKVIFGLPISLLEGDNIKPAHLSRLKKITKTLSLAPCGFIEYPQALSFYLQTKEESPPTLLLLSIGKKQIAFSHIRVGKIEKNVLVEKTDSIVSDFEKALLEFSSSEILPSRIMLYDESGDVNTDEIQENLLKFPWHKHSTFLHTPKIETLQKDALAFALVEAAARSLAHKLQLEEKEGVQATAEEPEKKKELHEETFGFIKGKDITLETVKIEEEKEEKPESEKTEETFEEMPPKESIFAKLPRFNFSLPQSSLARLPMVGLGLVGVLIVSFSFFLFWYYPKAIVNLIVYPASSTSNVDVLFTTDEDTAASNKKSILATTVSEEASADKTASTTGKIKIGEKATGTVTIYNKTLASKTFPKGSILTVDNLKFTLDDDVTIASASDTGEGLTFGKGGAKITAADIGPEGNVASGSNFNFQSFDKSSYYAKNTDKLSGGTSREITSVSKEDQDKLLSSLSEELADQAKLQMMQKLSAGEKLLDTSLTSSVSSKKFTKNIGEESKELSLSLTLKISGLVYKEKVLLDLTRDNTTQVPAGFTLASDRTNIKISEAKTDKEGDVMAKATITYYFFPQIDTNKIKSNVVGKNFTDIDKYLSTIKEIGGFEIIADPKVPFFSNKLPFRKGNIQIRLISS